MTETLRDRPLRAFIHVQHLLGTGHAVRAAAIGRALAARGVAVTLATGNTLPPTLDTGGLDVVALPPVRATDASFLDLVQPNGAPADGAWRARRVRTLLTAFERAGPDILVTETFPFGRRKFAFEMAALLEAARTRAAPPLIASSIRDILVRKQDARKEEEMAETARRRFDVVLVHSDPDFVRLEDSFPFAERIAGQIRYTGFVHTGRRGEPPPGDGEGEVVVSCGGGAVGMALLETATRARGLSQRAGALPWRLLAGHDIAEDRFRALATDAAAGLVIERARPDFPGLLKRARLSVSQAGYNTVLDVLAAQVPAVFIPFAQAQETEQTQRAEALSQRGRAILADEATLTPQSLAAAVDAAMELPRRESGVAMNGAERSAEILIGEREARP